MENKKKKNNKSLDDDQRQISATLSDIDISPPSSSCNNSADDGIALFSTARSSDVRLKVHKASDVPVNFSPKSLSAMIESDTRGASASSLTAEIPCTTPVKLAQTTVAAAANKNPTTSSEDKVNLSQTINKPLTPSKVCKVVDQVNLPETSSKLVTPSEISEVVEDLVNLPETPSKLVTPSKVSKDLVANSHQTPNKTVTLGSKVSKVLVVNSHQTANKIVTPSKVSQVPVVNPHQTPKKIVTPSKVSQSLVVNPYQAPKKIVTPSKVGQVLVINPYQAPNKIVTPSKVCVVNSLQTVSKIVTPSKVNRACVVNPPQTPKKIVTPSKGVDKVCVFNPPQTPKKTSISTGKKPNFSNHFGCVPRNDCRDMILYMLSNNSLKQYRMTASYQALWDQWKKNDACNRAYSLDALVKKTKGFIHNLLHMDKNDLDLHSSIVSKIKAIGIK